MANLKVKLVTSVPGSLDHRAVVVHDDNGTFRWYIGDSSNSPVQLTPDVATAPIDHQAIDNTDSPYTVLLNANHNVVIVDASGGAVTVALPPVANWTDQFIIVKKTDATNNITISPDGSETIDGSADHVLNTQYDFVMLFSDGSNIHIV